MKNIISDTQRTANLTTKMKRHHIRGLLRRQAGSFVGGAGQLQVERLQESRLPHQGFRRTGVRVCFCLFADKLLLKA